MTEIKGDKLERYLDMLIYQSNSNEEKLRTTRSITGLDADSVADKLESLKQSILQNQDKVLDFEKKISEGWKFYPYKEWVNLEHIVERLKEEYEATKNLNYEGDPFMMTRSDYEDILANLLRMNK